MPRRVELHDLDDDQLLCQAGNHAPGWPVMTVENYRRLNVLAWRQVRTCTRGCGTEIEEWFQPYTWIPLRQQPHYEHDDGFLLVGGRDVPAAKAEMRRREIAHQGWVLDENGYPVADPGNVTPITDPLFRSPPVFSAQ